MHAFGPATSYPLSRVDSIPQPVVPETKVFRRKGGTVASLEMAWEWVW
jgi:hypothetical protein